MLRWDDESLDDQDIEGSLHFIDKVDRAQFIDERTIMMQEWADYLDAIAEKGEVFTKARSQPTAPSLSAEDMIALFKQWQQGLAA